MDITEQFLVLFHVFLSKIITIEQIPINKNKLITIYTILAINKLIIFLILNCQFLNFNYFKILKISLTLRIFIKLAVI